ncbi:MAG TPA: hypothetical protein VFS10_03685 [Pyrinomonadaceae bacterium]|nr:hypothetical protein [Pyrinomonadaceae bacterium]
MSASLLTGEELLGLFELDEAGTVLYSRTEPDGEPGGTGPDMSGRNFYDEVVPFENVAEFRRLVTEFTRGASPADSFKFDCRYEGCVHPVKVLLARICEHMNHDRTKSVLVHIRKAA